MLCVLSRLMGNTANRDTDNEQDEQAFLDNLNTLTGGKMERFPHSDTLKYSMEGLPPKELAGMRNKMLGRLIRNKVLDGMRTDETLTGKKHFLVAIDGVHYHTSSRELPHSTHKTRSDGTVEHMLTALEAHMVCPGGVRIPLMTEPIENPEGGEYNKQDSELVAAKRLLVRLRDKYPRLPMIILMDGLYLCEDIVNLTRKNHMELSVTVKDNTSAFLAKAEQKMAADHRNRVKEDDPADGKQRVVTWTNHVQHTFGKTKVSLNVLAMTKTGSEGKTDKFVYATSIFIHKRRATNLLDDVCRTRWQIEEAFKVQKCHGLGLEQAFGTVGHAGTNYYHIVQIANIILELMLHSNLFRRLQQHQNPDRVKHTIRERMMTWYGTIKNLMCKFKRSITTRPLSQIDVGEWRLEFDTA
ncbi:hypothetical protein J3R75_001304 [Oligosphaera ethanolica]|nr:hypothetical protein [Oligosphaera ethanolica]